MTYFLDACCEDWTALIGDGYSWVWPIPVKKKLFNKVYQPLLAQQLGPIGQNVSIRDVQEGLIQIEKKYWGYNIKFNEGVNELLSYVSEQHRNIELDIRNSYEKLIKGYKRNAVSNIKKASKSDIEVVKVEGFQTEVIDMFIAERGKALKELDERFYLDVKSIYNSFLKRNEAETWLAKSPQGIIAGVMILNTNGRLLNFFTASGTKSRSVGAMHLIFDTIIKEYSGKADVLDFEGSNNDNLAYFYKSFGGEERVYLQNYKKWNIPFLNR